MKPFIILIGDNNIANYSLIKFLAKKEFDFDEIVVVYTERTKHNINNLKSLLNKKFLEIDVEDVKGNFIKVKEKITNELLKLGNIEKLFLDFTGGLKSMSLGAYLAIDEFELDDKNKFFSYVMYDNGKSKIILKRGEEFDLNEHLSIEEIAKIHNIFDLNYKKENSEFFNIENVFWLFDKLQNEEKEFFCNLWDKRELKNLDWQSSLKNYPTTIEIASNKKLQKLQKYIKGEFLEEYIFYLLNEIKDEIGIYEIAWNVTNGKGGEFEVDVIATKNNNLYLFSCTTDKSKKITKTKGFEAKERATQLGGKNAKTILISCISKTKKELLKQDLAEKKGGVVPEIIVYEELIDIIKLKEKLKQIF